MSAVDDVQQLTMGGLRAGRELCKQPVQAYLVIVVQELAPAWSVRSFSAAPRVDFGVSREARARFRVYRLE